MSDDLITANPTALWFASGSNLKTLAVSPSSVGALMVFVTTYIATGTLTAVSGGGCPASGSGLPGAWQRIAGPLTNNAATPVKIDMWMGKVTTAGASTITMTVTANNVNRLSCKEFNTIGGLDTIWTQDGAGATKINTASTDVTFPTQTPSGENRLYVGYGTNGTGLTTGQTAGYSVELDFGSNPVIYGPDVANSAQSPISKQTGSAVSYTIGALVKADNPPRDQFLPFFM